MNFQWHEEYQAFRKLAQEFTVQEITPNAKKWDEESLFPIDTFRKAAELGLASIYTREETGGSGLTRLGAALIFEQLAAGSIAIAAYLSVHNMVCSIIDTNGSKAQRHKWLPQLAKMDLFASYCLTEPNSGSDAASLSTTAVRDGNDYILNGTKAFISGGGVSDLYCCMVRTSEDIHHGISCILVEKDTPGLSFGKKEQKMGWNCLPTSMVFFEDCRVPISNRIGDEGIGFKVALSALDGGRVNIAACSLGGAQASIEYVQHYLKEREQFGHKLADFQAVQFKLADMVTQFEAAKLMVYRAAAALDDKLDDKNVYCAMAKRFATDTCFAICNDALQMLGGYGYLKDYPIERHFRDLRVHSILEGTNEIMRIIIAKGLLNETFKGED